MNQNMSRHVRNSWKEQRGYPLFSSRSLSYIAIYAGTISLTILACTNGWTIYFAKNSNASRNKEGSNISISFNVLYTKEMFFNCHYVRTQNGVSRGAFTEQTIWLQIFGNWNQRWSTELCGDRPEKSSRTQIVFRNVERLLYEQRWNIYKMLRNEYKDNFISVGLLTVKVCTLNYARTSQFFVHIHYDDRNDATLYVWVWWMYWCTFERLARYIRRYDRYQVYDSPTSRPKTR